MTASLFSVRRFFIVFSIAWLVLISDHVLLLYWFGFSWNTAIIDSLVSNLLLLAKCLLTLQTMRYYADNTRNYMNILVLCLMLTLIWALTTKWLLQLILGDEVGYTYFLQRSLLIRSSIAFLVLGIVTMMGIVWYNWQDQQKNEQRKADAEKLAKDAELFRLRQQLQPHFLFNSLNSINALIGLRPEEARKMVQQLSDFLRGTIKKEETQWVSLREELQYLQLYLDIEKVRFGNRLATDIQCEEATAQLQLPALLLQPIVENAIKFGLYDTIGEITIRLQTRQENNELVVSVSNPFDPETSSPKQGTGFGLASVQRRLYLLFARNDLLSTACDNNIYTTTIKIPQIAAQSPLAG